MKKLNDIEIFIQMLEKSTEDFRVHPINNETHVRFPERNIAFIFDEKGKFSRIIS